jgi:Sodium/hydrogen exchanger family
MHELIGDITLCILFAWVLGLLAHFFRQPLILAYLIAGFFIGPFGVGWVKSQESISIISELGLIFMLFLSVPDSLLKGANNEKLVRHVRALNPTAKIVATADLLSDVDDLYAAGADYVTVTRLSDARELYTVIEAADAGLLEDKRAEMDAQLAERKEVLP